MGGYGAMRYSLAHPDLFGAAIVLSPAVYFPMPPSDSSTREFGAFGKGTEPVRRDDLQGAELPGRLQLLRGDGAAAADVHRRRRRRVQEPEPGGLEHDLDFEAHVLFNKAARVANLTTELRVVNGGHDWDVWGPEFVEGAKYIFQYLKPAAGSLMKATLTGTAGEERAGGVATDAAGNVYQAIAAAGPVDGQPYAGDKDLVLVKHAPSGTTALDA